MTVLHRALRAACAGLLREILEELAKLVDSPCFALAVDYDTWQRTGQESFLLRTAAQWQPPADCVPGPWMERLAGMSALRETIAADTALASRVDTLVGAEFSAQHRPLARLVLELVTDLVTATGSWNLDEAVFEPLYERLEQGLMQDTVRFIDVVPLLGFSASSDLDGTEVTDGVVLRQMTDRELSHAVQFAAVPVDRYLATTSLQVSRLNQWALTAEHHHPLRTGPVENPRPGPPVPVFGDSVRTYDRPCFQSHRPGRTSCRYERRRSDRRNPEAPSNGATRS